MGACSQNFFANQWIDLNENITDLEIKDFESVNVDTPSFVISIFSYAVQSMDRVILIKYCPMRIDWI